MTLIYGNLLKIDRLNILDLLGTHYYNITFFKERCASWNDSLFFSMDSYYHYVLGNTNLRDLFTCPFICFCKSDPDEMDVFLFCVLSNSLKLLILFNESGTYDTGWDCHHTNPQKAYENTKYLTGCGDRVNIAVSNRKKRGCSPPDT